jgi:hypothetical protein
MENGNYEIGGIRDKTHGKCYEIGGIRDFAPKMMAILKLHCCFLMVLVGGISRQWGCNGGIEICT